MEPELQGGANRHAPPQQIQAPTVYQVKSNSKSIMVKFEFITLKKVLKMSMSNRASIKSLKPLFAAKLDY